MVCQNHPDKSQLDYISHVSPLHSNTLSFDSIYSSSSVLYVLLSAHPWGQFSQSQKLGIPGGPADTYITSFIMR
jgi:hypothetical protein